METPNLTDLASLVGESFSSRVEMLNKVIGSVHYPSVGRYKERLISELLKESIPKQYDVATGFVLFPSEFNESDDVSVNTKLNRSAFSVSKQCDIIVYDSFNHPIVFKDGDFVVVRPEAVKCIIEIKSTLSSSSLKTALEGVFDFAQKWRETQKYYRSRHHYIGETDYPSVFILAWDQKIAKSGNPEINARGVREAVAKIYRENQSLDDADAFPILDKLFVYNKYEISRLLWMISKEEENGPLGRFGFHTVPGKFVRSDHNGNHTWGSDRTIASLIASIHATLDHEGFNRFFSHQDEVIEKSKLDFEHQGFSPVWVAKPDNRVIIKAMNKRLLPHRKYTWTDEGPSEI